MFGLDAANRLKRRYRRMYRTKLRANDIPGAIQAILEFKDKTESIDFNQEDKKKLHQKLYKYAKIISLAINDRFITEDNDLTLFKTAVFSNRATDKVLDKIEKVFKTHHNTLELIQEYEKISSVLYVNNEVRVYMAELVLEKLAQTQDQHDNDEFMNKLKDFARRQCLYVINNIECKTEHDTGYFGEPISSDNYSPHNHAVHLRAAACLNRLIADNNNYKKLLTDIAEFIGTRLLSDAQLEAIKTKFELEANTPITQLLSTPMPTDGQSAIAYLKMLNNAASNIYLPRNEATAIDKKILPLFIKCMRLIMSREIKLTSGEIQTIDDIFTEKKGIGIGRFNSINYEPLDQNNSAQTINCMHVFVYLECSNLEARILPNNIEDLEKVIQLYEKLSRIGFIPPDISPMMSTQEARDYFTGIVNDLNKFIDNPTLLERLLPGSIPRIDNLIPESSVKSILSDAGLSDETAIEQDFLPWLTQQGNICEQFLSYFDETKKVAIESAMLEAKYVFKQSDHGSELIDLDKDQIRSLLIDEMKGDIISIPVLLNGRIYDKGFIDEWIKRNPSDPFTRAPCLESDIKPCPWLLELVKYAANQYKLSLEKLPKPRL